MRLPLAALATAAFLAAAPRPGWSDNQMGYQMLSAQAAAELPNNHGTLGMQLAGPRQISESGLTFDLIRVKQVSPGGTGARAGLHVGDQIIAVDGRVFPTLTAFAAYISSLAPGASAEFDYIPAGGGPAQAQRVAVSIGGPAGMSTSTGQAAPRPGMSTGAKVAIGVGAAALFGCYEMGCFSHHGSQAVPAGPGQQPH